MKAEISSKQKGIGMVGKGTLYPKQSPQQMFCWSPARTTTTRVAATLQDGTNVEEYCKTEIENYNEKEMRNE